MLRLCRSIAEAVPGASSSVAAVSQTGASRLYAAFIRGGAPVPPAGLLSLSALSDNPGASKTGKRVGRGIGSGKGKTSGRGHKGQKSRSGGKPHIAFEGGQTPLRRRLPKRGFINIFKQRFETLNLDVVQAAVEAGRLPTDKPITLKDLEDNGIVTNIKHGVKLLARDVGPTPFALKGLQLEVSRASVAAREKIEQLGGTVTTVHYSRLALRALLRPEKFIINAETGVTLLPRPAAPPPRLRNRVDAIGGLPAGAPPIMILRKAAAAAAAVGPQK